MFLATGFNEAQLNVSRLGVYAYHTPAGTSVKNILHMAQLINSGEFCRYDYGSSKNTDLYGSEKPPNYALENITNKNIALFSSQNDWMSTAEDVEWLRKEIKGKPSLSKETLLILCQLDVSVPLLMDYIVPFPRWNHADFLFAIEAGRYVNTQVIQVLNSVIPPQNESNLWDQ